MPPHYTAEQADSLTTICYGSLKFRLENPAIENQNTSDEEKIVFPKAGKRLAFRIHSEPLRWVMEEMRSALPQGHALATARSLREKHVCFARRIFTRRACLWYGDTPPRARRRQM